MYNNANDYSDPLVNTVVTDKRQFYRDFIDAEFFHMPTLPVSRNHLLHHLAIFRAKQADEEIDDQT